MIKELFSDNLQHLISDDKWLIVQDKYNPSENLVYETNFALTNGYMCTRGSYEEGTKISLPSTFIAGIFDKSEAFMRELANTPDWLGLKLYYERQLIGIEDCEVIQFIRVLDMRKSILFKRYVLKDSSNRETLIEGYRFISRNNLHRAAIRLYVTPLNYSGIMELENIIDGTVVNFKDFPRFRVKHLDTLEVNNMFDKGCYIETTTRDWNMHIGTGCILSVRKINEKGSIIKNKRFSKFGELALEFNDFEIAENETVIIEKFTSIYTDRDNEVNSTIDSKIHRDICIDKCEEKVSNEKVSNEKVSNEKVSNEKVSNEKVSNEKVSNEKGNIQVLVAKNLNSFISDGIDNELDRHIKIYDKMWYYSDIKINGDELIDKALRFNIFHLMSTANNNDDNVSLGAKLLHGEEYGGHVYWDTEIFMLPFFIFTFPKTAKKLLMYRYNLLNVARENAKAEGYNGAKYPWESADDGKEQCPDWTIEPDGSCYRCLVAVYEHHVTADVAYGVYTYYKYTNDIDFLVNYGAEILLETSRFWVSRCEYIKEYNRYEINRVTGPDEWHENVDNNCYTNYMAKWNIKKGVEVLNIIKDYSLQKYSGLINKINLSCEELKKWKNVCDKIYIPYDENKKLIEQFEGYFKLKDFVIKEYDNNDMPIIPHEARKYGLQKTCINKQADVVMLMYLLNDEFSIETQKVNYEYYEKRTSHRSSLSPSIFSIMGLRVGDSNMAYKYLKRSSLVDLNNNQRNTREGIHAASTGGTWQSVVFGFCGMSIEKSGVLSFNPHLPEHWDDISFKINYKGCLIEFTIKQDSMKACLINVLENSDNIKIMYKGKIFKNLELNTVRGEK